MEQVVAKAGAARSGSNEPMLGKVVAGRYRLEARLGEGGMGVVYRARHVLIERVVALKLIRPDLRGETHLRAWMLREARAANRVDHAHIIDIHDIGETEDGELYLVMEYLVGTALATELARGPMPLARGVDILEQMCAALARAHDLGVVHRDLKSDNILLTVRGGRKDFVKILHFGLAGLARDPRLAPKGAVGPQGHPPPAPAPPPPPQSPGVIEWASRAALFSRMVSRAYPSGNAPQEIVTGVARAWDLAARANRLEGEVATHTRKLEALERRGRALRAEIGRKVEELAHEESRVLREGAAFQEEAEKVRGELVAAERAAQTAKTQADQAERSGQMSRAIFERAGAAEALIVAKKEWLQNREAKQAAREATARDLRRQIEELRSQLSRYAEALEEDLASGREKVSARTREGLAFEKAFTEVTTTLVAHLKGKPECRDLLMELSTSMTNVNGPSVSRVAAPPETASRTGGSNG